MALCAGNVWLEADNLGLGGVYLGVYPEEERMTNTSDHRSSRRV